MNLDAALGERQCHAAGADAKLQGWPTLCQRGQQVYSRPEDLSLEHRGSGRVIIGSDVLIEMIFGHGQSILERTHWVHAFVRLPESRKNCTRTCRLRRCG